MASAELGQITDFLHVLRRRVWQIVVPAMFVLAFGVVFAVIVPKKYVVSTKIELLQTTGHVADPEESATLREVSNSQFHLRNHARIREVIVRNNWLDYARLDPEDQYDFIASVRDNISVSVLTPNTKDEVRSAFVEVEYADIDGERGVKFLRDLTARWIDDVVQQDFNLLLRERDEYQNQVGHANQSYSDILTQFTALVQEMGISITQPTDLKSQREEDPLFVELGIARQQQDAVGAELEGVRAQIAGLTEDFEAMELEVPVEEVEPGVEFRKQILALEGNIAGLRRSQLGKTSENSIYKRAQVEIEGMLEQIVSVEALEREATRRTVFRENPLRQPMQRTIADLELKGQGLEARLVKWSTQIDAKTARHQAQVANWNDLLRLHKAWEHSGQELDEASARLRAANSKIATYSAVRGEPYRIAEPPRAPSKPTEPSPVIIILSSLLGGLAIGLAVAFLAEFSKSCFRSVGDVSRVMGVPILGVVNLIQTRADVRRRRFKRLVIGGSTLMILGSLGWFTYAWSYDQAQLPTRVVQVVEDFRLSLR